MNELQILTEDQESITLYLSKDKNIALVRVDGMGGIAGMELNLSQIKQIANFLNQVL